MKLIVDRLESEYVVCENLISGEIVNLDRTIFPQSIQSGDWVEFVDGTITILPNEEAKKRIKEKMERLWK